MIPFDIVNTCSPVIFDQNFFFSGYTFLLSNNKNMI